MKLSNNSDLFLEEFPEQGSFGFRVLHGKGGGSTSTPADTTTTNKPFPAQEKALTALFDKAETQFQAGPAVLPDQTLAAEDPLIGQAQTSLLDSAAQFDPFGQSALQAAIQGTQAAQLGTPEFEALAQKATNPIIDQFRETIFPGIASKAAAEGAFGGSRQGITEAVASRELARAVGDTRVGLFQAGQANLTNLIGVQGQLRQSLLAPAQAQLQVGAQRQGREQAVLDDAASRLAFEQNAPELALDRLAARISGINIGGTSSTTGGAVTTEGGFSGGGAIGGAAAGFKISGGNPIGAVIGGVVGGFF